MSQRIKQQAKLQDYKTLARHYDLLGRRTSKNDEQYGYNVRDELTFANNVSYNYDDIGNRITAEGKTYTVNNLNQYTAIDDFVPEYDANGNQTLIKTETGIWSVLYNAENRPIRWESDGTIITMSFDRMGRRVEMRTVRGIEKQDEKEGSNADSEEIVQRFVYDNYLCVQQLRTPSNALFHSYIWDPTEPIATRPLIFLPASSSPSYYFHDGNKNISDLVDIQGRAVHYGYTPFGAPTASSVSDNPFRFSSEYYGAPLELVYYNYRFYNPLISRWNSRDWEILVFKGSLYGYCQNSVASFDLLGLASIVTDSTCSPEQTKRLKEAFQKGCETFISQCPCKNQLPQGDYSSLRVQRCISTMKSLCFNMQTKIKIQCQDNKSPFLHPTNPQDGELGANTPQGSIVIFDLAFSMDNQSESKGQLASTLFHELAHKHCPMGKSDEYLSTIVQRCMGRKSHVKIPEGVNDNEAWPKPGETWDKFGKRWAQVLRDAERRERKNK